MRLTDLWGPVVITSILNSRLTKVYRLHFSVYVGQNLLNRTLQSHLIKWVSHELKNTEFYDEFAGLRDLRFIKLPARLWPVVDKWWWVRISLAEKVHLINCSTLKFLYLPYQCTYRLESMRQVSKELELKIWYDMHAASSKWKGVIDNGDTFWVSGMQTNSHAVLWLTIKKQLNT